MAPSVPSQYKDRYGEPHFKDKTVARPHYLNMGIHQLVKRYLYIETAPSPFGTDICWYFARAMVSIRRELLWSDHMKHWYNQSTILGLFGQTGSFPISTVILLLICGRKWLDKLQASWLVGVRAIKSFNILSLQWDIIAHPCPNVNGSLYKPLLKLRHGCVITSILHGYDCLFMP